MQPSGIFRSPAGRLSSIGAAVLLFAMPAVLLADQVSDVAALEAQCEQERDAKIQPLREMEIAKCKADKHNSADFCERFWKDYGAPVRLQNGNMGPRLFSDLPICVAAADARAKLNLGNKQSQ
jgi:hypothetical protein